jgi:hypothetical protein
MGVQNRNQLRYELAPTIGLGTYCVSTYQRSFLLALDAPATCPMTVSSIP